MNADLMIHSSTKVTHSFAPPAQRGCARRRRWRRTLSLGVVAWTLIATSGLAAAQPEAPVRYRDPVFERVERTVDIVYGTATDIPSGEDVELELDMYEPAGDEAPERAALVFIHGGGFVSGDKSTGQRWGMEFARRGWVVLSIGYRLRQGDLATVGIPAAVSDARQAVRWVHEHAAQHRLDASRVAIGGSSAGAITSLFLAYTDLEKPDPEDPAGVVAVMDLWGGLYGQEGEMTADEPPLIIVHGTEDTVVPFALAEALRDRAEAVGIAYDYRPLQGVGHGSLRTADISAWTAEFFYAQLWPQQAPTVTPTHVGAQATATATATAATGPTHTAPPRVTNGALTGTPTPTGSATRHPASRHLAYLPIAMHAADLMEDPSSRPTTSSGTASATPDQTPPPSRTASPTAAATPTSAADRPDSERVVTLLVDDGGRTDPRLSLADVERVLGDVQRWYVEASYGRTTMTFDVRGWYEIDMDPGRATDPRIYRAAVADGVDFRAYDHVLILWHGGSGFGSSNSSHAVEIRDGDDTYPLEAAISQVTRLRDTGSTRGTITHELGHALGLPHTSHLSQTTGEISTYGTLVDTMGGSRLRGHFNALYKHQLGWLDDDAVARATSSGDYVLRPLERDEGVRMLVVPVPEPEPEPESERRGDAAENVAHPLADMLQVGEGAYVLETRRPIGDDSGLGYNVYDGALIYRLRQLPGRDEESVARFGALSIDASPETPSAGSTDFALMPGRTFSDHQAGVHITVLAVEEESTTVRVVRQDGDANRAPVVDGLTAAPDPGDPRTIRFSADARDPDGDALHVFWNLEVDGPRRGGTGREGQLWFEPGTYAAGPELVHHYELDQPRTVCATVSDARGGVARGCVDLFGAENEPPMIRRVQVQPAGPRTVKLVADFVDRQPLWITWDYGDEQRASFISPQHTYASAGRYTARLTVTDGEHTVQRDVEVDATQEGNVPPIANAGQDQTVAPGARVQLDGSDSIDPDDFPIGLRYIWNAPDPIVLSDPHARAPTFIAPDQTGEYVIELRVYDGDLYGHDHVTVTVEE